MVPEVEDDIEGRWRNHVRVTGKRGEWRKKDGIFRKCKPHDEAKIKGHTTTA